MKIEKISIFKRKLIFESAIVINKELQTEKKISDDELKNFFPSYLTNKISYEINLFQLKIYQLILFFVKLFVKKILNPRKDQIGNLDKNEVEKVYNKEAKNYWWKHHMTTAGNDSKWRAETASSVITYARINNLKRINLLDICTGTGHTSQRIVTLAKLWGINVCITGIDYCEKMLSQAKNVEKEKKSNSIKFLRGDATNMSNFQNDKNFVSFKLNEFDIATQMFGIGGIDEPLKTFQETLKILKNGGHYHLSDMHKPVKELGGEMFLAGKWIKLPSLEMMCYEEVTIPLALNLLWGWRDTTTLFYLVPLVTFDESDTYYGFELVDFIFRTQKWYLGLPFVPTAKGVYKKIKITKEKFVKNNDILSLIV